MSLYKLGDQLWVVWFTTKIITCPDCETGKVLVILKGKEKEIKCPSCLSNRRIEQISWILEPGIIETIDVQGHYSLGKESKTSTEHINYSIKCPNLQYHVLCDERDIDEVGDDYYVFTSEEKAKEFIDSNSDPE